MNYQLNDQSLILTNCQSWQQSWLLPNCR